MNKSLLVKIQQKLTEFFKRDARIIDLDTIKLRILWRYSLSNKEINFLCSNCSMLESLDVSVQTSLLGLIITIKSK